MLNMKKKETAKKISASQYEQAINNFMINEKLSKEFHISEYHLGLCVGEGTEGVVCWANGTAYVQSEPGKIRKYSIIRNKETNMPEIVRDIPFVLCPALNICL